MRPRAPFGARFGAVACAAFLAAGSATAAPRNTTPHGPINFDAARLVVDYRTQHAVLEKVVVSQGDLRVTADRAEAADLDSEDSRWTFTGNVHISSGRLGDLRSDSATIEFRNGAMRSALATGHPAEFEHRDSKSGVPAHGHATTIEYDASNDTVRLAQDASLEYGENQRITAPVLVYGIREQKLQAAGAAAPGGRVHVTTVPNKAGIEGPARRSSRGVVPGSAPRSAPRTPPGRAPGFAPQSPSGPP
jgi:lipopolysaccharide transport protein LptA